MELVRIDDEGLPLAISNRVKERYAERMKEYGRALFTPEEMIQLKKKPKNKD